MSGENLKRQLESSGLPVTWRAWPIGCAPELPWVAYYFSRSDNFMADGIVYAQSSRYMVELYCRRKDPEAEARLEAALSPFAWEKSEVWLPEEKMLMILYEISD